MVLRSSQARAQLVDCTEPGAGSGAELILVEGDSAMHPATRAGHAVGPRDVQAVIEVFGGGGSPR